MNCKTARRAAANTLFTAAMALEDAEVREHLRMVREELIASTSRRRDVEGESCEVRSNAAYFGGELLHVLA